MTDFALGLRDPIQLFAANQAVKFVPSMNTYATFIESSVTDQHWSVRETQQTAEKK